MRLFFALWPPSETALTLAKWAGKVQGREIPAAKIHLTLAFLGDAEHRSAIEAAKAVKAAPFDLPLDVAKYWQHNKIVWVGPKQTPPALQAMVHSLHGELERRGFRLEDHPFAAHVTLLRDAAAPKSLPALPALSWPVREFVLMRSVHGAYERVEAFPLGDL
jgi:RNA 2',3'-cyclic 3'-phosphodiesterase